MPLPFNLLLGNFFTPLTLSPTAWYKAGVSPMTFSSGVKVSQWNDISGNANHLANSVTSSQPSYNATGLNSSPTIQWNKANSSVLATASGINMNSSTACTVFMVGSITDAQGVAVVFYETPATINSGTLTAFNLSGGATYPVQMLASTFSANTTNISEEITSATFSSTPFQLNSVYTCSTAGSTYIRATVRSNGTTVSTTHSLTGTNPAGTFNSGVFYVGNRAASAYSFDGYISELIVFNYALTQAQIVQVENYLSNAWNVPNNSPQYTTNGSNGLVSLTGGSGASDLAVFRGDLGLTYGTDGYSTWADQTTNANNFAQATALLQPVQSHTINSQACMSFSGSTAMSNSIFYPNAGVAKGIMLVYKITTLPTAGSAFYVSMAIKNSASAFSTIYFFNSYATFSNISYCFDLTSSSTVFSGINPTLDTNTHTLIVQYNGGTNSSSSSYTTYYDGVLTTQGSGTGSTSYTASSLCSVGGALASGDTITLGGKIDIAELHTYTGTITPVQLSALQSYWTTRYGDA